MRPQSGKSNSLKGGTTNKGMWGRSNFVQKIAKNDWMPFGLWCQMVQELLVFNSELT